MSDFEQQLYTIGKMAADQRRQELEDKFDRMKIDRIASEARAKALDEAVEAVRKLYSTTPTLNDFKEGVSYARQAILALKEKS